MLTSLTLYDTLVDSMLKRNRRNSSPRITQDQGQDHPRTLYEMVSKLKCLE